ncbi:hypothetical protein HDU81_010996 [Chytriomyces hyalinus]|nr:hypothetical protein HDU81_010996 [Chytriomyces hyalinus]
MFRTDLMTETAAPPTADMSTLSSFTRSSRSRQILSSNPRTTANLQSQSKDTSTSSAGPRSSSIPIIIRTDPSLQPLTSTRPFTTTSLAPSFSNINIKPIQQSPTLPYFSSASILPNSVDSTQLQPTTSLKPRKFRAVTGSHPNQEKKIDPPNIITSTDSNYAAGAENLGLNTGTVVSLSVGGVAIVCAILGFAIFVLRRRAASRGNIGGDNAHEVGQGVSSLPPPSPNGYHGYQGSMKLRETDHLLPLASTPLAPMPLAPMPLASMPLASMPLASMPLASMPLASMSLASLPLASLTSHSNLNKNNSLMSAGSSVSPVQSDSSYLSPSGDTTSAGLSYSPSVAAYHSPPPQPNLGEKGKAVNDIKKHIPLPAQEKDKSRFKEEEGGLFDPISASQFGGASSSSMSDSNQPGLLSEYDRSRALNAKDEKRGMFLNENLGESSKCEKLGNPGEKGNAVDEDMPAVSQRMNVLTCSPDMWEVEDVTLWMKAKGISHEFIALFQEHQISGQGLLALSDEVLREDLGIKDAGARQTLLELVAKLKEHETRPEDAQADPSDAPPAYDEGDLS